MNTESDSAATMTLLREGIAAANSGARARAHELFSQVTEREMQNGLAWLWLAAVSASYAARLAHLERALEINPHNQQTQALFANAKRHLAGELLQQGINAVKERDTARAREFLTDSTKHDPSNEVAWLWLAAAMQEDGGDCVETIASAERQLECVNRALELNSENSHAQNWLAATKSRLARAFMQKGIDASTRDERETARAAFRQVLVHDSNSADALFGLAKVADDDAERMNCLRRVMELNPQHIEAVALLNAMETNDIAPPAPQIFTAPHAVPPFELPQSSVEPKETITEDEDVSAEDFSFASEGQEVKAFEVVEETTPEIEAVAVAEVEVAADEPGEIEIAEVEVVEDVIAKVEIAEVAPVAVEAESSAFETSTRASRFEISPHAPQTKEAAHAEAHKHTVMIVDDSPTIRKLVAIKLEKQGHRVVQAADGMEALAKINDELPDLVLLDVTMPRLDGYQLCKLIKTNDATKHIPVVMLSGKDGFFDKVRGKLAGSVAYLTKPFDPTELARVVEEQCNRATANAANLNAASKEATVQAEA
ncbi:MAG: hypothetical protein NVSMB56_10730 [Pyrinomonadaceae bacterium]